MNSAKQNRLVGRSDTLYSSRKQMQLAALRYIFFSLANILCTTLTIYGKRKTKQRKWTKKCRTQNEHHICTEHPRKPSPASLPSIHPALVEPCQLCADWNVLDATKSPITRLTTVHAGLEWQFSEAGLHSTVQTAVGDAMRAPHNVWWSL